MLKKLLKYDFKAMLKFWWIGAVIAMGLGVVAGVCIPVLRSERDIPQVVMTGVITAMVIAFIGMALFAVLTLVLVFIRFYRNFFTDQGYLTFTLPVKRSQLLNSKLISGVSLNLMTALVLLINAVIVVLIGFGDKILTKEFFEELKVIITELYEALGAYTFVYLLEALALGVLCVILSYLFMFCCITLASIITKKARIVTSIGIYYGANALFGFVFQIFVLFGIDGIATSLEKLTVNMQQLAVALLLLCMILLLAMLSGVLYILQYWMLDRKLNLA